MRNTVTLDSVIRTDDMTKPVEVDLL